MRTSTSPRRPLPALAAATLVALAVGLTGCGDDASDAGAPTTAPPTTAPPTTATSATTAAPGGSDESTIRIEAPAELTSAESRLIKVGEGEKRTYGWNKLVGSTSTELGPFEVEMLGNVDYLEGNGPFFGFVTLTAPSGELLGLRMDGEASVGSDGSTALEATFEVVGGTGQFVGAGGTGSLTGSRKAAVGAPIEIVIILDVSGLEQ
jgi:hypothetical protein